MEDVNRNPFSRYSYTFNSDTGEVETPDVYLLDKNLHKLGRLYPVIDLNIIVNAADADEVSFTYYKYYNDEEQEMYSSLLNYSIAFIQGFGCFELKVTETDREDGVFKTVSGQALGNCELSQITATVEVNTDDDTLRDDYYQNFPTVFYRDCNDNSVLNSKDYWQGITDLTETKKKKILKESSLLHRILSYAPHYQIGHVDPSLYYVQRQFSFDKDIHSCLQEVAQEVGCIFTYNTYLDDADQPVREINAYDTCYCQKCYKDMISGAANFKTMTTGRYRSVTNGICDNCGSSDHIYDYGEDTDIFITTENLTDEIQIQPENEVKNCFKISGGDDLVTSTVQALQMTSSNRIMMFSDEQKAMMSKDLQDRLNNYNKEYKGNQELFEDIVKTEYNVIDLIQYLQSGKMPLLEEKVKTIQEEVQYVLSSIIDDYKCNFYVSSYSGNSETSYIHHAYTCASNAIKNLFTLYLDKGYSVKVKNGDSIPTTKPDNQTKIQWNGIITIYETDDRYNNYADIHVQANGTTYVEYGAISDPDTGSNLRENYNSFHVSIGFGDTDTAEFREYIKQYCETRLADFKDIEYENRKEKDWSLYCYERLLSYHDGYEACLDALNQIKETSTENERTIVNEIYRSYSSILKNIEKQMLIVKNQINALYQFYGVYPNEDSASAKNYIKRDYPYDLKALNLQSTGEQDFITIIKDLADDRENGNYIGNKPFACKVCGSSNVGVATKKEGNVTRTYNYCKSCDNSEPQQITTYGDVAAEVVGFIEKHEERGFVKDYYLDCIGESVYSGYLSPSISSYHVGLKNQKMLPGYIIYSNKNIVSPFLLVGTRKTKTLSIKVKGSGRTAYIIENLQNSAIYVQARVNNTNVSTCHIGQRSENGIGCVYTNGEDATLIISIPEEDEIMSCIIYKCTDNQVDSLLFGKVSNTTDYRGKYIWCSSETYKNLSITCNASSITPISDQRKKLSEYFSLEHYFGDTLYKELMAYIREDQYENSNYTSDGCLTNAQLVEKASELLSKAKQELAKACHQQYSISSPIYSIVATKYRNWSDDNIRMKIYDEFELFKLGNWIRARIDHSNYHSDKNDYGRYKMRLISIQFDFNNIDNTNVTYSNVERNTSDAISRIQDTLASASSMASSYEYYADQAEQGNMAKQKIDNILQNGYDSALAAVKAGENQEITMDRHGLLFRRYIPEMDDYSKYQMKMINRNIVMTDDNWQSASLAIGLGMLPDGTMGYGIWADNIIGGKIHVTDNLTIENEDGSVIIDGSGIRLRRGSLEKETIDGLNDELNDIEDSLARYKTQIDTFKKEVVETLGAEETKIGADCVISPRIGGGYLYIMDSRKPWNTGISVEINPTGTNFDGHNKDYVFNISKNDDIIMGVTNSGDGYFKGNIETNNIIANGGKIGGWEIERNSLIGTDVSYITTFSEDPKTKGEGSAVRIYGGKIICEDWIKTGDNIEFGGKNEPFYVDMSSLGIYAHSIQEEGLSRYLFAVNTLYHKIEINGKLTIGDEVYIDNKYLRSTSKNGEGYNKNLIGFNSNATNIYIGMYYYDNRHHPGDVDNIFLSASTTQVLGTLLSKDGASITSDLRYKTDIQCMNNKEIDFILGLSPKRYKLIEGTSNRYHYGFVAQDVEQIMNDTIGDVGLLVKSELKPSDDSEYTPIDFNDEETFRYGLRYEEFIAPMVKTIQYLNDKINHLEDEIKIHRGE